ncbi:MAG: HlyC/CorC family transporter [Gammaproteobacteria bacterium]|nr:HlyC/CorC family transporter [Gammaproteobacteria bacterium]
MNELLVLFLLLILSGLFSGSETALVALSLARVEGLVNEHRKGSAALLRLKKDPTRMLITILIGNNLVNIASASMATVVATRWFGQLGPGLAVGVLTIMILIFGEITPKSLATRYAERISLMIAPPLYLLMRLIFPLVWLFQHLTDLVHRLTGGTGDPMVTESELIHMARHGAREGTIEHGERELIERIFTFGELEVQDVMTPHDQVFALDGSLTVAQALPTAVGESYSRILVYEKDPDEIQHVFHLRDLLDAVAKGNTEVTLKEISNEVVYVPQNQGIDELFTTLRTKKRHIAVVVDEFGVLRGIVTLEDLMEELFGEIYDESDTAPQRIKRVSDEEIAINGTLELREVQDFFRMKLSGKPTDTVNFWILKEIQRIPVSGEKFVIDGLEVRVGEATPRCIERVVLHRSSSASNFPDSGAGAES